MEGSAWSASRSKTAPLGRGPQTVRFVDGRLLARERRDVIFGTEARRHFGTLAATTPLTAGR